MRQLPVDLDTDPLLRMYTVNMRSSVLAVFLAAAVLFWPGIAIHAGTCGHAYMVEGQAPPAFDGITIDGTFTSYFWAWGANTSDQGLWSAPLVPDGNGIAVNGGVLWSNSSNCNDVITGTGLLVENQTAASGGIFAIVAAQGAEVQIDELQGGSVQSSAQPVPRPSITSYSNGTDAFGDYADIGLGWTAPSSSAWALSDVGTVHVGYAVYFITAGGGGPIDTGDKSQFTRVEATANGTVPYITDDSDTTDGLLPESQTSCVVRIREGAIYYFSVSLIFDGSGSAGGDPQADASAVESTYVGQCSVGANADPFIFSDGFESGYTTAWSNAVP